mmetsp:Transcript_27930/g.50577  ORF Transcript_27930/g.50577 Transcript_27930/m.50577 type:complete len:88 (-) Transcript_27930:444-707(-)
MQVKRVHLTTESSNWRSSFTGLFCCSSEREKADEVIADLAFVFAQYRGHLGHRLSSSKLVSQLKVSKALMISSSMLSAKLGVKSRLV